MADTGRSTEDVLNFDLQKLHQSIGRYTPSRIKRTEKINHISVSHIRTWTNTSRKDLSTFDLAGAESNLTQPDP